MSRVVFLLEEYSMKVLLDGLLPRLFPDLVFQCVEHEGKRDLERSIPRKLRAWREPGVRFCVIRDNDGADCEKVKQELQAFCHEGGRDDVLVRIACQELESWYFGDPEALSSAYQREDLRSIAGKAAFRDPDAIARPSKRLEDLVEEFQKVSGARRMAHLLTRRNSSRSFQAFVAGVERLVGELSGSEGGARPGGRTG